MCFQQAQKVMCIAGRIFLEASTVSQEGSHLDMIRTRVKCLWKNCLNSVLIFFSYKLSRVPSFLMWN